MRFQVLSVVDNVTGKCLAVVPVTSIFAAVSCAGDRADRAASKARHDRQRPWGGAHPQRREGIAGRVRLSVVLHRADKVDAEGLSREVQCSHP